MNGDIAKEIAKEIDLVIRKRKDFNSISPLEYKCCVKSLDPLGLFIEKIKLLPNCNNITFINFITLQNRFTLNINNQVSLNYLTPYNDKNKDERLFGKFKCNKCINNCINKWNSRVSWCNMRQRCHNCNSNIYPYIQIKLEKKKGLSSIPHDSSSCEKCIIINNTRLMKISITPRKNCMGKIL
jgi:hypothetical protein